MSEIQIYLPIVFHFHQPVDNFNFVIEDAYEKSYKPLIENVFKNPKVKITLHFSGNLLEWFLNNKPNFIEMLKVMAKRGQIEIIGGGYYEPIFAIIPNRDKIAQIKKLSDLIKKEFGLDVKGAWLSERVWEPNYPSFLSEVGLKYTIVDDNHFRSTGITEKDTLYSYVTEDEGKTLRIFPINEALRYLTPWKPTYLSIEYLRKMADEKGDRVALLISDAEKMGVWGTTHEFCYVEGKGHEEGDNGKPFIPAFFEQIVKNKWIKSITLSDYMEKFPARGLVYLPTASYDKMELWALPLKSRKRLKRVREEIRNDENRQDLYDFLRGGFWRHFLVKYPESNNMHKKMLYVRDKLINIETALLKINDQGLIKKILSMINETWEEIYKSQCNDCYWHGFFGGVYLQFLRFSVYTHLINAEILIDRMRVMINSSLESDINIIPIDLTKDSKTEYLVETDLLNVYISPNKAGTIFELDYKPKSYNLLNTLTRWPEAYHDNADVDKTKIMVDRFKRSMLRLRFLRNDVTLKQLQADQYCEFGDFVDGSFKVIRSEKEDKTAIIEMERIATIKDIDSDDRIPVRITKDIHIEDNEIKVVIRITFDKSAKNLKCLAHIIENLKMAIDIPFFFNGDADEFQFDDGITQHDNKIDPIQYEGYYFRAYDGSYDLNFEISIKCNSDKIKIYKFPLITYVYTDEGYKEIYQGICITPTLNLKKEFKIDLTLKIS